MGNRVRGIGSMRSTRGLRFGVRRSGARMARNALLYSTLTAIAVFLLIIYGPGRSLSAGSVWLIVGAVTCSELGLYLLQQLSGHWIFHGDKLYFSSFFLIAEYRLSEFSSLSVSRRKQGRVLALSLRSEYEYGESLEFWFRDWRRQPLCELMSAILESNGDIQVTPNLAHIVFLWSRQPAPGAASEPEADLLSVEESLLVVEPAAGSSVA
jgi:hypothetical protein